VSEKDRQRGREFAQFLQSLPEDQRTEGNRNSLKQAHDEHKDFSVKFARSDCYLCNAPLASFDKGIPCAHWLLNPKGFKKDNFPEVTKRFGFFQLENYLSWVANEGGFARNINNLKDEGKGNKLIELTIRYNELIWGFSCSESDYIGHATSKHTKHAHYHFQMRVRGHQFIKYNDFHVAFTAQDIGQIEAMRAVPDLVKVHRMFGAGMEDVLTDETIEHIINNTVSNGNYEDAPFKLRTIIKADERATINGDDLANLIAEAKAKRVPVASLVKRLPSASVQVFVSPGPGVVAQAPRTGRGKGASAQNDLDVEG